MLALNLVLPVWGQQVVPECSGCWNYSPVTRPLPTKPSCL